MSMTSFGVNDTLAVKLWSKQLETAVLPATWVGKFLGTDTNSLAQIKVDTQKNRGDKITFGLRMLPSGAGVTEGQVMEGNEEALSFYADSIYINELMNAFKSNQRMDNQRVTFDMRDECYQAAKDWHADRFDTVFFNHLCGYTVQTDARYTGNNAITAPSTNRIIRAGAQATDQALNSNTYKFTLDLIDSALEKAKLASPLLRPIKMDGEDMWVLFLHPTQTTDLQTNTTDGQWFSIQKAAMQGGRFKDNPLLTGASGVYKNVIIHESTRITQGVHSTAGTAVSNTRRAVFCGAQAVAVAFGMANTERKYTWVEQTFDYERFLGVSAGTIFGVKKTTFNSEDYGAICISTYAATH